MHNPTVGDGIGYMQVTEVLHNAFKEKVHPYYKWYEWEYIGLLGELEEIPSYYDEWDAHYHSCVGGPHGRVTQDYQPFIIHHRGRWSNTGQTHVKAKAHQTYSQY